MKKILSRWKLGIKVFGRWLLFTFALGLVCWPLNFLKLVIPNLMLNSEIYMLIASVVYLLVIFPFAFYFTAQWSGILQEDDKEAFRRRIK